MNDKKHMRVVYAGKEFGKSEENAMRLAEKVIQFVRQGGETVTIEVVTSDFKELEDRVLKLESRILEREWEDVE
ncbi:MAG: hypothetical protein ACKOX6_18325 [Bdellovibrio sp.]